MKAFFCHGWGDASTLRFEPFPVRPLQRGEVRIDVGAADIGFQDALMIAGKYQLKPAFPFVPGNVAAGRVSESADGAIDLKAGDRVVALMPYGAFSQQVILPAASAVKLPDAVAFDEAAVLAMPYATAYQGLVDRAQLQPKDVLLVRGAAGGVGLAAVELGRALGATVIAAASSRQKLAVCAAAGADHLVNTSDDDVRERVLSLTTGRGADVIFDTLGTDFKNVCLRSIARRGRILIVGFAGGEIPAIPANYVLMKLCAILGVGWGYSVFEKEPAHYREVLSSLLTMRAAGRIAPRALKRVGPDGLQGALLSMTSRAASGRSVLVFEQDAQARAQVD